MKKTRTVVVVFSVQFIVLEVYNKRGNFFSGKIKQRYCSKNGTWLKKKKMGVFVAVLLCDVHNFVSEIKLKHNICNPLFNCISLLFLTIGNVKLIMLCFCFPLYCSSVRQTRKEGKGRLEKWMVCPM